MPNDITNTQTMLAFFKALLDKIDRLEAEISQLKGSK